MYFEKIRATLNQNLRFYSNVELVLAAMIFGIPFTINFGNALLIFGFLFALYQLLVGGKSFNITTRALYLFFPILFFLIVLTSAGLSKDVDAGFIQVEKNLLLVIIPFTLHVLSFNKKINYTFLLKTFTLANFTVTFLLLTVGILRILKGASFEVIYFHEFGSFLELHPVYVAINICVVIFFISQKYLKNAIVLGKRRGVTLIILLYFYTLLFLCASKAIILCFVFLYPIQLCYLFKKKTTRLLALIVILGFTIGLLSLPQVSDRFVEGLHFNISNFRPTDKIEDAKVFSNQEKEEISDLELRYLMFKIGWYHIKKDKKLLFGYGIGDVQNHTDYHYMIYGLAPGWFEGYNLHNQYLQFLVSYGLIGAIFFLVYLAYSFIIAISAKNRVYMLFLILMTGTFVFESLLSRNKGIVIFIFFNSLFIIQSLNENSHTRNKRNPKLSWRI